ncbi:MAG: sodium-independent anion transporter, partial [Bacteroidota bacterium]
MDRVPYIDQSGLYALEDIIFDLRAQNSEVILVGLKGQPNDMLQAIGIIPDLIPEEAVFDKVDESFTFLKQYFNK